MRTLVSLLALSSVGACSSAPQRGGGAGVAGSEHVGTSASALACPSSGRPGFVLYYGSSTSDYDSIIAAQPAFVVLGDMRGQATTFDPSYFHSRDPAIQVLAYIPMNYGDSGSNFDPQCGPENAIPDGPCTNVTVSYDCTYVNIDDRISNAMSAGYDGVFFDETPTQKNTYVQDCASRVKAYDAQKLVVMNPGTKPSADMFSDNVDIVSVEKDYPSAGDLTTIAPPGRWMAVEDGVPDASTAESDLRTFRSQGGFWYYGTSDYTQLPSYFSDLTSYVNGAGAPPSCSSGGASGLMLTVSTYDQANGSSVQGLWTVVDDSAGTQHTGYSPISFLLPAGATSVSVADYQQYQFNHWDDGTTARPRQITLSANTTVTGWYAVAGTATVGVHTYNQANNAEISGLWTVITDAAGVQHTGYSPITLTLPTGTTSVSVSDYAPYTFNHWDDGSTARPRQMAITGDTTVGGYYAVATTATLNIHTFNQADNSEITGLWTVVDDSAGVEHTGYSPISITVPLGTTSVSVADYQQYHFNHWDDWTTARPRSIAVSGDLWVGGWYAVQ